MFIVKMSLFLESISEWHGSTVARGRRGGRSAQHGPSIVLTVGSMQGISGELMRLQNTPYAFDKQNMVQTGWTEEVRGIVQFPVYL